MLPTFPPTRSPRRARQHRLAAGLTLIALLAGACSASDDPAAGDSAADTIEDGKPGDRRDTNGSAEAGPDGGSDRPSIDQDPPEPLSEGGGAEVVEPELAAPDDVLPTLQGEVATAIEAAVASPDVAILDVAGIIDDGPTAEEIAAFGDGRNRTSAGELVILDDLAGLACANVEIALTDLDEGNVAGALGHVGSASERAGRSEVEGVQRWASPLAGSIDGEGAIDATVLVGFLSVCLDGGYVL